MLIDDVAEVIVKGLLGPATTINRFHYQLKDAVATLDSLLALVRDNIVTPLAAWQANNQSYDKISGKNLRDPAEGGELGVAIVGTKTGDMLPPFVAVSYQLVTPNALVRNGGKRFGGIVEADIVTRTYTPAFEAELVSFASNLDDELVDIPSGGRFVPVVYTPGNLLTPVALAAQVTDVILNTVSSQVSRKTLEVV